jgi:hypothetical protein
VKNVNAWATAISKHNSLDKKIIYIYIYIQKFDQIKLKTIHQNRIIVVWEYFGINGMPDASVSEKINYFENTLASRIEDGVFSTLAIVSTGDNLREWTYYVASEDEFFSRLNDAFANKDLLPIKIYAAADPNWDTYNDFLLTLR